MNESFQIADRIDLVCHNLKHRFERFVVYRGRSIEALLICIAFSVNGFPLSTVYITVKGRIFSDFKAVFAMDFHCFFNGET